MYSRSKTAGEPVIHDIAHESGDWPAEDVLHAFATKVAHALGELAKGHITYVFTDDARIRVLNREWRGKDKATNVLSFPDGDADENGIVHLGDVIVARETLEREAAEYETSFDDHLTHLLLHGSLHLLGYDHIEDDDAEEMEALEIRLLAAMGIKDPYQGRDLALD